MAVATMTEAQRDVESSSTTYEVPDGDVDLQMWVNWTTVLHAMTRATNLLEKTLHHHVEER
jgi:hypothetical protein